jgi:hypothetical protein
VELDAEEAAPAYVARLGTIDARGIDQGTKDAERAIRYVTKYVTKDIADQVTPRSDPQRAHFDRMHAELSTLPCSPSCANWLLYGVQPDNPKPGLIPGRCTGKVHQPRHPRLHRPPRPHQPPMVRQNPRRPSRRQPGLGPSGHGRRRQQ